MALVGSHVPKTTRTDRAAALRSAIVEAQRHGITSVQNAGGDADDFELYAEARRDGDLGVRVYAALSTPAGLTESAIALLDAVASRYPDDPLFKAGAIKIVLDGVIEAGTAAMLAPYADGTESGTTDHRPGRFQPNRARARPRRLAGHDARRRGPGREHGAHGLRTRRAIQPAPRARPAAPHRAHRNGRCDRPSALRRARRRRVDAAVPGQPERPDRRVVQECRSGTRLARLALRTASRPAPAGSRSAATGPACR